MEKKYFFIASLLFAITLLSFYTLMLMSRTYPGATIAYKDGYQNYVALPEYHVWEKGDKVYILETIRYSIDENNGVEGVTWYSTRLISEQEYKEYTVNGDPCHRTDLLLPAPQNSNNPYILQGIEENCAYVGRIKDIW